MQGIRILFVGIYCRPKFELFLIYTVHVAQAKDRTVHCLYAGIMLT